MVAPFDYNSFIFEWADVRRRFTRIPVTTPSPDVSFACQPYVHSCPLRGCALKLSCSYVFHGDTVFPRAPDLS